MILKVVLFPIGKMDFGIDQTVPEKGITKFPQ